MKGWKLEIFVLPFLTDKGLKKSVKQDDGFED